MSSWCAVSTGMVPIWQFIITTLALLGTNTFLFFVSKRKIETLQMALVAKRALLGQFESNFERVEWVDAGEVMTLQDSSGNVMEIRSLTAKVKLQVRVFDR